MSASRSRPNFRLKPLALCVAVAGLAPFATHAEILELTAQGTYQLGADSTVALNQTALSGSVDVLSFPNSGGNQAGLHSYGSDNGNFGTRSSGVGVYDVTGLFRIRERLVNTDSVARQVSFNFNITPGLLSNDLYSAIGAGEFVQSSIDFNVVAIRGVSSTNVFNSHASLRSDETGLGMFSATGSDAGATSFYTLASNGPSIYYNISSYSQTLDLGVLGAGEELEVDYVIRSAASGISTQTGADFIIPEQIIDVPGHWEWSDIFFISGAEAGPDQATNGECGGYGEGTGTAPDFGVDAVAGPNLPPTDSPCWVFIGPHQETIPEQTIHGGNLNGSHASSGDPLTLALGPHPGELPGYYAGSLPLLGGITLGAVAPPVDTHVPAPGALVLLGFGLSGLWFRRRQR